MCILFISLNKRIGSYIIKPSLKEMGQKNVHMECVQISIKRRVKKWGKSAKIRSNFKLQYIKLETSF